MKWTRENNATGRFVHSGIYGFYLMHVCVYVSLYVCVTEEEVKKGHQLKIIGTNFYKHSATGEIYLIRRDH